MSDNTVIAVFLSHLFLELVQRHARSGSKHSQSRTAQDGIRSPSESTLRLYDRSDTKNNDAGILDNLYTAEERRPYYLKGVNGF